MTQPSISPLQHRDQQSNHNERESAAKFEPLRVSQPFPDYIWRPEDSGVAQSIQAGEHT